MSQFKEFNDSEHENDQKVRESSSDNDAIVAESVDFLDLKRRLKIKRKAKEDFEDLKNPNKKKHLVPKKTKYQDSKSDEERKRSI